MYSRSNQLIRTNPILTSNIKLVVSSNYDLFLESFDSNKELSDTRYKHYRLNRDTKLEDAIVLFYKSLPITYAFDVKYNNDNTSMQTQYSEQFDDMYFAGAKKIEDRWHVEEFEYLAPLYIRKNNIPKSFIVLRVDEPCAFDQTTGDLLHLDSTNFREQIINNWKCVKMFDMSYQTNIGYFLNNNITTNNRFPSSAFEFNARKYNFSKWRGLDYYTGIYTDKSLFLDDKLMFDNPHFNLEKFITTGYRMNGVIFPYILNLKFLFDDNPATPYNYKKYSLNRYFGFYLDQLEEIQTISSYDQPTLKTSGVDIINNIFITSGTTGSTSPFVEDWDTTKSYFIVCKDSVKKVDRITYDSGSTYQYKIISNTNISVSDVQDSINNLVDIVYTSGTSYTNEIAGRYSFGIDSYLSSTINYMYGDLYLINIDGIYHVIYKDGNEYYIRTDYSISLDSNNLFYFVAGLSGTTKTVFDNINKPLSFKIYRAKFTNISDIDTDIISSDYANFEYEKIDYYNTNEHKLYEVDYDSTAFPKPFKYYPTNSQYAGNPVISSSEYVADNELFEVIHNNLSDIWKKNPVFCKWGFVGSTSHSDYPYKLNNSMRIGSVFNRTTDVLTSNPNEVNKNMDYFYRIGKLEYSSTATTYLQQSTNIETELLYGHDSYTARTFDMNYYMNSDIDYFKHFFDGKMYYSDVSGDKIKNTKKYAIFSSSDNFNPSTTIFRGLKLNLNAIKELNRDTENKILNIVKDSSRNYDGYACAIILNKDINSTYTNIINYPINEQKNKIHIFLNDRFKNLLIILNCNITGLTGGLENTLYDTSIYGENNWLYNNKSLDNISSVTFSATTFVASNFIAAINNPNELMGYDDYITYYYIDSNGVSGKTIINSTGTTSYSDIDSTSWNKTFPPYFINIDMPDDITLNIDSYETTAFEPNYVMKDKFIVYQPSGIPDQNSYISNILGRRIDLYIDGYPADGGATDQALVNRNSQGGGVVHGSAASTTKTIYRYSGPYEPILKDIQLFNKYDFSDTYNFDDNYKFNDNLGKFGMINELVYSKVNPTENILKMSKSDKDKSMYPLVDEFGYQVTSRFIFMSPWDKEFYLKTNSTTL